MIAGGCAARVDRAMCVRAGRDAGEEPRKPVRVDVYRCVTRCRNGSPKCIGAGRPRWYNINVRGWIPRCSLLLLLSRSQCAWAPKSGAVSARCSSEASAGAARASATSREGRFVGSARARAWIGMWACSFALLGEELRRDMCRMVDIEKGETNAGTCAAWRRSTLWYSAGRTARRTAEETRQRAWASTRDANAT
jgi:hypothetical protein